MTRILVLTPTLGDRESLTRTIKSVKEIGGDKVRHVIVCPEKFIPAIKTKYGDVECLAEPQGKKGIYPALNHGFHTYGKDYDYLTFINDDDYWLPDFAKLIDAVEKDPTLDMVYSKTMYVNKVGKRIWKQASSNQFYNFRELLHKDIVLLTQQTTLVKSDVFFKIGGFDDTYKLIADTKFWLQLSLMRPHYKYLKVFSAAYTIQEGQLSSDKSVQKAEHVRLLGEFPSESDWQCKKEVFKYRLSNIGIYLSRLLSSPKKHTTPPLLTNNNIVRLLIVISPWHIKRWALCKFYRYDIHPKARIGLSYIFPKHLMMEEGARIGHLNVAIHLELIYMEKDCSISQKNWITGFPLDNKKFFQEFPDRKPYLIMKKDSAITKQHLVDCTDTVTIGELTSVGGYGTQILSHSTSLEKNRQSCAPITIGHHCFVGTRSIILPGSILPDHSVLGAGAVMKKQFTEEFALYGGVPAKFIKKMDETYEFFHRTYRPK